MPTFSQLAFIDIEASSLGSSSFPTELGWAIITDDGEIESSSCLIRPPPKWTLYANAWSDASERLTGITRPMLEQAGLHPRDVMERFLRDVENRDLFSDNPDFDAYWLAMLADAAGTSVQAHKIGDAKHIIGPTSSLCEPRHRAEADARALAAAFASRKAT